MVGNPMTLGVRAEVRSRWGPTTMTVCRRLLDGERVHPPQRLLRAAGGDRPCRQRERSPDPRCRVWLGSPVGGAAREGAIVTGFYSSPAMIKLARQRLGQNAALCVADLSKPLPFADAAGFRLSVISEPSPPRTRRADSSRRTSATGPDSCPSSSSSLKRSEFPLAAARTSRGTRRLHRARAGSATYRPGC